MLRLCCAGVLIVVTAYSSLCADDINTLRTWTNQEGQSLQATLLDSDPTAQTVRVRRDDGRIFTIEWNRLSTADQALLQAQHEASTPADTDSPLTEPATSIPSSFKLKKVPEITQKGNFCVPASAAMIAGYHGVKTDQDQIAQLSSEASISNEGTYPSDMLLAMGKLGFDGQMLKWDNEVAFKTIILPQIRSALVKDGPIYISFRPNVFGSMGHGCVITGYNDRSEELYFYNPWGHEFQKDYVAVAGQAHGVVLFAKPTPAPIASDAFITHIQKDLPHLEGDILAVAARLKLAKVPFELIWCSRRDARDDERFAIDTARRDGRTILELAFKRNPAVVIPYSLDGHTQKYYFVTRPAEGGASYMVREITAAGWSAPELKTLGHLTRNWATSLMYPDQPRPIWELPMIQLHDLQ